MLQDGFIVSDGGGGIGGLELITEGVDEIFVAVHGNDILVQRHDDQLIRETAHPLLVRDGRVQVVRQLCNILRADRVERAAGEGVQVHHVGQGGGPVDEGGVLRREGQQIADVVRIADVHADRGVVGGGELFIVAVGSAGFSAGFSWAGF